MFIDEMVISHLEIDMFFKNNFFFKKKKVAIRIQSEGSLKDLLKG
jgi:hypothetical protein